MQTFNIAVCVTQCRRQGGQRGFAPICELLPTQKNMNLAVFNVFWATFGYCFSCVPLKSAEAQAPSLVLFIVLV